MAPTTITSTLKPDAPAWIPGQFVRNDEGTHFHGPSSTSMWDASVPESQYLQPYAANGAPSPSMWSSMSRQQPKQRPQYNGSLTPFTDQQNQLPPVPLFVPNGGHGYPQQAHSSHFYPGAHSYQVPPPLSSYPVPPGASVYQIPPTDPFFQDQHFQQQHLAHAWEQQQGDYVNPQDPYARQLWQVENARQLGGGAGQMDNGTGNGYGNGNGHGSGEQDWNDSSQGYGQHPTNGYDGDRATGCKGKKPKKRNGKKWKNRENRENKSGSEAEVAGGSENSGQKVNGGFGGKARNGEGFIRMEKKIIVRIEKKSAGDDAENNGENSIDVIGKKQDVKDEQEQGNGEQQHINGKQQDVNGENGIEVNGGKVHAEKSELHPDAENKINAKMSKLNLHAADKINGATEATGEEKVANDETKINGEDTQANAEKKVEVSGEKINSEEKVNGEAKMGNGEAQANGEAKVINSESKNNVKVAMPAVNAASKDGNNGKQVSGKKGKCKGKWKALSLE